VIAENNLPRIIEELKERALHAVHEFHSHPAPRGEGNVYEVMKQHYRERRLSQEYLNRAPTI